MTPIVVARDIRRSFRSGPTEVEVLAGASLELRRGEVVALEGPSGCGKSTLLSILGCVLSATSGELVIDGERIGPRSDLARLRRDRLAFVFQQFNLIPALSALDNAALPLRLAGANATSARRQATHALEFVGLADRASFLPRELSGGQMQRVAIARALVTRPAIIYADEPTANLDADAGQRVLSLLCAAAARTDAAVLIVSHDPRVRAAATRVLRMIGGVVEEATANERA